MTARQRAMLERKTDKEPEEQLMSLPSGTFYIYLKFLLAYLRLTFPLI